MTPRPLEEVVKDLLDQRDLGVDWAFLYRFEIDLRESLAEREKKIETDKNHYWHNGVMICLCEDQKHAWVNNPQYFEGRDWPREEEADKKVPSATSICDVCKEVMPFLAWFHCPECNQHGIESPLGGRCAICVYKSSEKVR